MQRLYIFIVISDTFTVKGMFTLNQIFTFSKLQQKRIWEPFRLFSEGAKLEIQLMIYLEPHSLAVKVSLHSTHIRIRMFRQWKWSGVKSFLFQPCQFYRAALFHGCCRAGAGLWCYLSLLLFHTVTAIIYGRHYRRHHHHRKCLISILLWAKICENCRRAGISRFKGAFVAHQTRMNKLPPTVW